MWFQITPLLNKQTSRIKRDDMEIIILQNTRLHQFLVHEPAFLRALYHVLMAQVRKSYQIKKFVLIFRRKCENKVELS